MNIEKKSVYIKNVFTNIINGSAHADIVMSDDDYICFRDINPQRAHHYLVIPKLECADLDDFIEKGGNVSNLFNFVHNVIHSLKLAGYTILTNKGEDNGQIVKHFHLHIMSH